MTPIERKAREYASLNFAVGVGDVPGIMLDISDNLKRAFLAGATYALGNQWRDAEKEKPDDEQEVLILTTYIGAKSGKPRTLVEHFTYFEEYGFWLKEKSEHHLNLKVLAWMKIPEYEPKKYEHER